MPQTSKKYVLKTVIFYFLPGGFIRIVKGQSLTVKFPNNCAIAVPTGDEMRKAV